MSIHAIAGMTLSAAIAVTMSGYILAGIALASCAVLLMSRG